MPFIQVLIFVIKYGTGILSLVRGIWELVDWLQKRDTEVPVVVTKKFIKRSLHGLARNAKTAGDLSGLEKVRDTLAKRKAEIEGGSNADR